MGNRKINGSPAEMHGMTGSREYQAWGNMRRRCMDKNAPYWKYYGGKGIKICERWSSFTAFFEDMGRCPDGFTLDRVDSSKDYEKSNCRWATQKQQMRNTSWNRMIEHNGQTKCLSEWAADLGLQVPTLSARLNRLKWSIEKAFSTPAGKYKCSQSKTSPSHEPQPAR